MSGAPLAEREPARAVTTLPLRTRTTCSWARSPDSSFAPRERKRNPSVSLLEDGQVRQARGGVLCLEIDEQNLSRGAVSLPQRTRTSGDAALLLAGEAEDKGPEARPLSCFRLPVSARSLSSCGRLARRNRVGDKAEGSRLAGGVRVVHQTGTQLNSRTFCFPRFWGHGDRPSSTA